MVKANDFATSGSTQFSTKSSGSIRDSIWITTNLQTSKVVRKKSKIIKNLIDQFGEEGEEEDEE